MITDEMAGALNEHMGRELGAHVQYLAIAGYFAEEGLPELAAFFRAQAGEEHMHAMRFYQYLVDVGHPIEIPTISGARGQFASAEDAVAAALAWEEEVTRQINSLVDLARSRSDHATEAFLQWFVTEQVEEVATMGELLRVVRRAGEAQLLLVEDYVARKAAAGAGPTATATG